MKNIYIYGAGSAGGEIYHWLMDYLKTTNEYQFKGFIGSANLFNENSKLYNLYLCHEDKIDFTENDYVIIGVAQNIEHKKFIIEKFRQTKVNFFNLIHPTAIVKNLENIGLGNIISPYSILSYEGTLGNFNFINCHVTIGHHVNIGDYNTFNSHCDITGYVKIGNENYFGSGAKMLPKSIIGNNNKIAASAVIYKKFKDNCTVTGNPAVKI